MAKACAECLHCLSTLAPFQFFCPIDNSGHITETGDMRLRERVDALHIHKDLTLLCVANRWEEELRVSSSSVVLAVIEWGLREELASSDAGDPLDDLSYTVVQVKPFLATGAKAIEVVQRAGGGFVTETTSRWRSLQGDRKTVADQDSRELRRDEELGPGGDRCEAR
jgi:hypothetical protein